MLGADGDSAMPEQPSPPEAAPPPEPGGPPAAPTDDDRRRAERLDEMFAALDKCVRGARLYQGEGAVLERQLADLEQKAARALEDGPFTVRVAPFGLVWKGAPVTPEDKRPPYFFRLFCDGVRELTFKPGIEPGELRALVDVLGADPRAGEDDLVTLLWKAELAHVGYYAVDALAEAATAAAGAEDLVDEAAARLDASEGEAELRLTSDDIRLLRPEDLVDWVREARAPAAPSGPEADLARRLREGWRSDADIGRFLDVAARAGGLRPGASGSPMVVEVFEALLRSGDLDGIRAALRFLARDEPEAVVRALRHELLSPDRVAPLAPVFAAHPDELAAEVEALAAHARKGFVRLLTLLPPGPAEARLQAILEAAGVDLAPFYLKRLESEDEAAVLGAIAALGRIGSDEARAALTRALASNLTTVRRAALEAMQGRYHPDARVALARALRDPDKENRMLACRILAASGDTRVAWSLLSQAQRPGFRQADPDEQAAVFEALAAFRDPRLVGHFAETLDERSLRRDPALVERQRRAVEALRQMGTDEARAALEKRARRWGLAAEVKEAIRAALASWGGER